MVALALALASAALVAAAEAQAGSFEQPASQRTAQQFAYGQPLGPGNVQRGDTPDDPDYDQAEPDTAHGRTSTNLYDERGRPDVVIAILDTGVKWQEPGPRLQVHLNRDRAPGDRRGRKPGRAGDRRTSALPSGRAHPRDELER